MRVGYSATAAIAWLALCAAAMPASAQAINADQWYAGQFDDTLGDPLYGGGIAGTDGPLPGGGNQNGVSAPGDFGTPAAWTISMSAPGYLVVTDVEVSGDLFQILVNGKPATLYGSRPLGGQIGQGTGYTSQPGIEMGDVEEDIGDALKNGAFSSATFLLPKGFDTINGVYEGSIGDGDFDFIAVMPSAVPEPMTLPVFAAGLAALRLARRQRCV